MQRWEYLVRVFELNKDDGVVVDYVTQMYPDRSWKELPEYDPLTLEAWLNQAGQEGWELVKVEGVCSEQGFGEPLFLDDTFWGLEYPGAHNEYVDGTVRPG